MDCAAVEDILMNRLAPSSHGHAARKSKSPKREKKANQQHRSRGASAEEEEESTAVSVSVCLSMTVTCRHCGDKRMEGEPTCGCEYVVAEYGSLGCDCCGYSYVDCRGQRASPPSSAATAFTVTFYEQYGSWMLEPCAKCSPKFVEQMRAVQKSDLWDYEAQRDWEHEQRCSDPYW
jgi:hypothetical protein